MKVKIKIIPELGRLARSALAVVAVAVSVPSASAVLTTYNQGDLFIGFRQTGASDTLVANLGSASKFLPSSLGGTAGTTPFTLTFGFIPNTATVVTNLAADLINVFGEEWSLNPSDGSGVHWAVVGQTSNTTDDSPILGLDKRSIFITKARTDLGVQTTPIGSTNRDTFAGNFNSFASSTGGTSYKGRESTVNSTVAYVGAAGGADNWNTRLGINGFGTGKNLEQPLNGDFSGPTNSILDLWLVPNPDSSATSAQTFLGSFSLDSLGQLTFTPVPEPSTLALMGLAAIGCLVVRRKHRAKASSR